MSPAFRRVGAVVAIVPVSLGALIAVALTITGDRRVLTVATVFPAVPLMAGAAVSLVIVMGLVIAARRRRDRSARANDEAEAAARGRAVEREEHRRFLARLDHELKNPITAIRATLAGVDPNTAPAHVAVIDAQARRLAALVGDLRKLAEIETRPLETEPVDVEALVRDAVDAVQHQRPDVRGRIRVMAERVPWSLPPLSADPDLLALAVDNVLSNAAKFAPDGPIEVRVREDAGAAVIEVADTGRGIPLDAQDHVFDDLARASNARDVPGSGIGLSLVRTIVRRHGGDVDLRSREGQGTVVSLRLPVTR